MTNSIVHVLNGALDGVGLAYVPDFIAKTHLEDGSLVEVLAGWCLYFEGFHFYHPNRWQASPAFNVFVDAVRYRG